MKMVFDKIGSTAKPFKCSLKDALLEGTLQKNGYHQVILDAHMSGSVELRCDRCGDTFDHELDNKLRLTLSDRVSEDKDDLDIIEFLDGEIDISYILQSEINTLESAYHYCEKCSNMDEDFEVEF